MSTRKDVPKATAESEESLNRERLRKNQQLVAFLETQGLDLGKLREVIKENGETTALKDLLKAKGIKTRELQEIINIRPKIIRLVQPWETYHYRFGVVSDTHLVDKACDLAALHDLYRRFKKLGIEHVVHAGDVATGQYVYKGQLNDLLCFGWSDHKKYVVENYPQVEGITTHFIEGNHDQDYTINFGAHFGEEIMAERPDMKFLGIYSAPVTINGVKIGLHHGAKGVPYALSYHLQKYIEKIEGGQKPQLYFLGHYHTLLQILYRNILAFLPGCFQRPNSFSIRLGLPNLVCGMVIDMDVRKKKQNGLHTIDSMNTTVVPYF